MSGAGWSREQQSALHLFDLVRGYPNHPAAAQALALSEEHQARGAELRRQAELARAHRAAPPLSSARASWSRSSASGAVWRGPRIHDAGLSAYNSLAAYPMRGGYDDTGTNRRPRLGSTLSTKT
jgi:hypothetical protein